MERVLERLSSSRYSKNFILKGGMLISSMMGIMERTTMEMEFRIRRIFLCWAEYLAFRWMTFLSFKLRTYNKRNMQGQRWEPQVFLRGWKYVKFLRKQGKILRIFFFIQFTICASIIFVLTSEQMILSYILFITAFAIRFLRSNY